LSPFLVSLFDFLICLPQAESELSDKNKREELDAVIIQARIELLRTFNLPTSLTDSDPKLREIGDPPFKVRVRAKAKEMLIDEEVRRRKYVFDSIVHEQYGFLS